MDRFTWGAVLGVILLSVVALASVLVARQGQRPPDLSTPEGVVAAYILAIQDKRADDAWDLLDPPAAADQGPTLTRDRFRAEVNSGSGQDSRRIRVVDSKPSGDTARVDVEITTVYGGPAFFGPTSYSHTATFSLKRQGGSWRITAAPSLWELR